MKCKLPGKGRFSLKQLKLFHKAELIARRERQLARVPDNDARLTYFSKNSLPEYRK